MRGRLLNLPAVAKASGFALVAVAIAVAALHFWASGPRGQGLHESAATPSNHLTEELRRCQGLATQAKDDAACEAAWAESRRRFFTYQPTPGAAAAPAAAPKSSDR